MNIAFIVPGGVDRSGTERVIPALLWLIERLAKRHTVHVFALRQEENPADWTLVGAFVHNIGWSGAWRRRLLASFARHHRDQKFDVVHAFGGGAGIHASFLGRRFGVPVLLQLTGGELVAFPELSYGSRLTVRGRTAVRIAAAGSRAITVASRPMQELAAARGMRTDIVPLGVALDVWPIRPPRPRVTGTPAHLLHVADINPVKDHDTMLQAASLLRQAGVKFHLDFAGVDTLAGRVQAEVAGRGLSDVTRWHGRLGRDSLRALVEQADLLVLSSRHEAGPVAVLEAAVAGVPTVGTAVGHIAEWASEAAVAVPCGDAAALAAAVSSLLADDPARLAIAEQAQRRAVAHDAEFTMTRFEQLYESIRE